jgi:hypothetical protein
LFWLFRRREAPGVLLLAFLGYGVFVFTLVVSGELLFLPGFVSSGVDALLVLRGYGVFSLFSVFCCSSRKAQQEVSLGEIFPSCLRRSFQARSAVRCRFLFDMLPSAAFPGFLRFSRRQPWLCRTSLFGAWHARAREISSFGRACGQRSAFQVVTGAVRGLLVAVSCRGIPGDGAWPTRAVFRRRKFIPDGGSVVWVFCLFFCIFLSLFTVYRLVAALS